jgi:hypothetical protein
MMWDVKVEWEDTGQKIQIFIHGIINFWRSVF